MNTILSEDQKVAVDKMFNGCILCGDVGSGKSRTAIAYYFKECGGKIAGHGLSRMTQPLDLYIITTARKRDSNEWLPELNLFRLSTCADINSYPNKVVVDSWNNIKKYSEVHNAFFIFDEQKTTGYGKWAKTFIRIARFNKWILASATPGDDWIELMPVFVANGYFRSKSDFEAKHVIYSRFTSYPKIEKYYNTGILLKMRRHLLVDINVERHTIEHDITIRCEYNKDLYSMVNKDRWNPFTDEPITNGSTWCTCLRKIVNSDISRLHAIANILMEHPKAIIFYSYDYELELLKNGFNDYPMAEWNGHKHEPVPNGGRWIYLVEYMAGAEAWNCITTDTIIFYSQQYSWKILHQSCGRINRRNTPYVDLYHYHLTSLSGIDKSISLALSKKKKFNENKYYEKTFGGLKQNG